jgi:hypothetical protein
VQDLQAIRNLKVYFGHQSVGANVIEGLHELEIEHPGGPILTDSFIGQNGDPEGKCDDFNRKFAALIEKPDVALMKFCYIDFDSATDPAKLFARYAATVDGLQAEYPGVTFIPVTAPLTTSTPGWKLMLKKLMGRADVASAMNAKRAEFNRLLIRHYQGRTIFDLALAESGGTAALLDAYSSDGAHLNALGRKVAAEELIHTLAAAARARSARVSPAASGSDSTSR